MEIVRDEAGRWPKGQSGNPGGRPKMDPLTVSLIKKLGEKISDEKVRADLVAEELVKIALEGQTEKVRVQAIKEIWDRTAGRPKQAVNIEAETGLGELIKAISDSITEAA